MGLPHVTLLPPFWHDCLSFGVPDIFHQATVAMLSLFAFLLLFFAPGTTCRGSEWRSGVVAGTGNLKLYQFSPGICTRNLVMCVCVCMICFFTHNKNQMTLPYGILARRTQKTRVPERAFRTQGGSMVAFGSRSLPILFLLLATKVFQFFQVFSDLC